MTSLFARIPARFTALLDRGEISFDHYGVMVFIVAKADYRNRQAVFPSLKTMQEGLGWDRTGRHLRDVLRELRELGEITYVKTQGSRDSYVITIVPADYFGRNLEQEASHLEQAPHSSFQVAEDDSKSGRATSAHQETDAGRPDTSPVPSESASTSKALRVGEDDLGWEDQGSNLDFDSLEPDVRENVERGRALNRGHDSGLSDDEIEFFGTARLDEIRDAGRPRKR